MLKKVYEKPMAEYFAFYSNEEITAELPLENYANDDGSMGGNAGVSGELGTGDIRPGVPLG